MNTITYTFEEIVLDVGTYKAPAKIALISGEAEVSYARTWSDDHGRLWEFEIEAIKLFGPIKGDPDVKVEYPCALWDHVACSILHNCHQYIIDEIGDANQPDSDAQYEAAREQRMGT